MRGPHHQRGVALLAAILLVAIGTILAASIAFQSAMGARRSVASLSFEQSALVAQGAEALAAYGLGQDGGASDDYSESWAKPFGPAEILPGVLLEASIEDLQGRFNLNSLVDGQGRVDTIQLQALQRLLAALQLEPKWADQIADWIDPDSQATGFDGLEDGGTTSQQPPYRTANTIIISSSELLALPGFGRERYLKLAPYVTALPPGTALNICTAPGLLLDAMVDEGYQEYGALDPEQLAKAREKGCWPKKADFDRTLDEQRASSMEASALQAFKGNFVQKSAYFRLTSIMTLGDAEFVLYSRLKREAVGDGGKPKIRVMQRSYTPD